MDRGAMLSCYFAAVRFKPDTPLNRWIGDRMAMVALPDALYVYARSGFYAGAALPSTGETHVRFRIPGETPYYMFYRHAGNPRTVTWIVTDVLLIDTKEADYAEFGATPADPHRALNVLNDVLRRGLESARAMLERPATAPEERDPHLGGIMAAARREAQEVVDAFQRLGW